jgi:DNA-binding MarR family transcriptional regulator
MNTQPLYRLIWQIRRLFQSLRSVSEVLLQGSGINPSQRAVLEFLHLQQPQTVARMAREKSVSRQHVQTVVNELLALGLVETLNNPAHKRSPLVQTTRAGNKLFKAIVKRESAFLARLDGRFSHQDITTTLRTLEALDHYLRSGDWR